jgi:cytochrome c
MRKIDSYTLNTVAGWVLGTGLLVFGLNALAGIVYHAEAPERPGMVVEIAEIAPAVDEAPEEEAPSIAELLAMADADRGQAAARACQACHTFDQGGPHRVGPNLWDIVGQPIAHHDDYSYSDALQAMSGDTWTYEALDGFIRNPRGFAPGTKMAYGGMQRDDQRADLLAYLRSLSDDPEPLPEPTAEEAAAEEPATDEAVAEEPAEEVTAVEEPAEEEAQGIAELVAAMDPEQGQAAARACQACHTFDEGGAHRVGPNLWDIVGQSFAHHDDYNYSDALQGRSDETWTLEALNEFILNPREFAPGTRMAYGGMRRDEQRLQLLAYLRTLSADPEPLSQPAAETPEDEAETPAQPRMSLRRTPLPRKTRKALPSSSPGWTPSGDRRLRVPARPATPSTRVGRIGSAPICGISSANLSPIMTTITIPMRSRGGPTRPGPSRRWTPSFATLGSLPRGQGWPMAACGATSSGLNCSPTCARSAPIPSRNSRGVQARRPQDTALAAVAGYQDFTRRVFRRQFPLCHVAAIIQVSVGSCHVD